MTNFTPRVANSTAAQPSQFLMRSPAATGGGIALYWESLPGRTYRVQYKNGLDDSQWADLTGDIPALGGTTSVTNAAQTGQRFYRIQLVR
jgi:hypothetical protein